MDSQLTSTPTAALAATDSSVTLELLQQELRQGQLTPQRRHALQQDLARSSTPAQRAELDALLRRLPAAQTADVRDLLYR